MLFSEFRVCRWNQCSPSKDRPGGCFKVGYLGVFEVTIKKISTFSNDLGDEAKCILSRFGGAPSRGEWLVHSRVVPLSEGPEQAGETC